jgi:hypothetical protein
VYARDNPMKYVDPSGRVYCAPGSRAYEDEGNLVGYDNSQCVSDDAYAAGGYDPVLHEGLTKRVDRYIIKLVN